MVQAGAINMMASNPHFPHFLQVVQVVQLFFEIGRLS